MSWLSEAGPFPAKTSQDKPDAAKTGPSRAKASQDRPVSATASQNRASNGQNKPNAQCPVAALAPPGGNHGSDERAFRRADGPRAPGRPGTHRTVQVAVRQLALAAQIRASASAAAATDRARTLDCARKSMIRVRYSRPFASILLPFCDPGATGMRPGSYPPASRGVPGRYPRASPMLPSRLCSRSQIR
jgi:hypothetical protein